jgi:hypothetical protein
MEVICDYCGEPAKLVTGRSIYPHRPDLYKKKMWLCEPCDAYVGCHRDGKPLGRLANAELRQIRMKTHALFDPVWKSGRMTRSEAYARLAKKLNIPKKKCHIGMFDVEDCQRVIDLFRKKRHGHKENGESRDNVR